MLRFGTLALVGLMPASCGNHTDDLLTDPSPQAAAKLLQANAPETCIHPLVLARLERMARGEGVPEMSGAELTAQARRAVVSVRFHTPTAGGVDPATKSLRCTAMVKAWSEDDTAEGQVSFEVRPVIGQADVAIIADENSAPAVSRVVRNSEDLIEAQFKTLARAKAVTDSEPLPPSLRQPYLDTLDGCDRGSSQERCSAMWDAIHAIEEAGWCSMIKGPDGGLRHVEFHRCNSDSIRGD